jgi:Phosphodiester glycosidase
MTWKRRPFLALPLLGVSAWLTQRCAQAYTISAAQTPWLQPGVPVLVPDWWLVQALGIELLSGQAPETQKFRWFADEFSLPVVPAPPGWPGRYVRLTDLAKALQATPTKSGLGLEFPPIEVKAMRLSKERLVLELTRPTPWTFQQRGPSAILGIWATVTPEQFPAPEEPLKKITLLQDTQIQFDLTQDIPLTPRAFRAPYRFVLDFTPRTTTGRFYEQLWQPGLRYQQQDFMDEQGFPQRLHTLQMDASFRWQLLQSTNKKTLTEFARSTGALAALNGGFFNLNSGLPLGAVRIDGRWASAPILGRGAVGWNSEGFYFDRLDWQGVLTTEQGRFVLVGWNTAYAKAGISVYTPEWGERYEAIQDQETIITVQAGLSTAPVRLNQRGIPMLIPPQGYLVVGRGYGATLLQQQFTQAIAVQVALSVTPGLWDSYPNILGAGPLLLKAGVGVLDADLEKFQPDVKASRAPRTAVGRKKDGSMVWVVAEGRQTNAKGLTLEELMTFMEKLGCTDAVNLDGGTSTGLYLGGALRNQTQNEPQRLLSTALVIKG